MGSLVVCPKLGIAVEGMMPTGWEEGERIWKLILEDRKRREEKRALYRCVNREQRGALGTWVEFDGTWSVKYVPPTEGDTKDETESNTGRRVAEGGGSGAVTEVLP